MIGGVRVPFVLAFTVATACSLDVVTPRDPAWEATIEPTTAGGSIAGRAAAVTRPDGSQIGILVEGAEEGVRLGWHVRTGSCGGSGERLGPPTAYPALEFAEGEEVEVTTVIPDRMASGGTYSVEVRQTPDLQAPVLACGAFRQVDPSRWSGG